MPTGFQNPTPEEVKANQINDLYQTLYPLIQRDFFHIEDAKRLHLQLNNQNLAQTLAFEELRTIFNTHTHIVATATGPTVSNPPLPIAIVQMRVISALPSTLYAQSLVQAPNPPYTLIPRKIGPQTSIKPIEIE